MKLFTIRSDSIPFILILPKRNFQFNFFYYLIKTINKILRRPQFNIWELSRLIITKIKEKRRVETTNNGETKTKNKNMGTKEEKTRERERERENSIEAKSQINTYITILLLLSKRS